MSAEATMKKRERQSARPAPARHSGAGRNLVPSSSTHPDIGRAAAEPEEATAAWREELLKDVASKIADGSHNPPPKQQDGVPMLSARNISANGIEFDEFRFITQEAFEAERKRVDLQPGDVLLTIVGSIGRTAVVPELSRQFAIQRSVAMIRPQGLDSKFCMYQLQSERVQKWLRDRARGSAQQGVYLKTLANLPMLIAPLPDQQQIVAEIEKQFTRLDAGVAALRRVQANLKRYRAAVLKAACEGCLVPTEAELAKAEGRTYETGEQLLTRILADRRKNWHGRGKYKEPTAPDATNLPPLPKGWAWTSVEQLLKESLCNGVSIKGSDHPPGLRALRLSAMSDSGFDYSDARYLPLPDSAVDDLWIQEGDFFISRGNGSLHLVGRGTLAQQPPQRTIFPDTMIRLRLTDVAHRSGWIHSLWPSRIIRSQIEARVKTTAGIYKIAQPQVGSMVIPLPPLAEQTRIVAEIDRRLSVIEELEGTVAANLQRATRLRQSILQRAFTET